MTTLRIRELIGFAVVTAIVLSGLACGVEETGADQNLAKAAENGDSCLAPSEWFPHDKTPKPNDSADFTTNCDFHQWSWQMFLWLTQTMPEGRLRFETFARPTDLHTAGGEPPAFSAGTAGSKLKLLPRITKSADPTLLDEINQAGSKGLLIDHNGRAVYYSMYINDVFFNFVRENGLYDPKKLSTAPDTLDFPVGSLELKAAWKIVGQGRDTGAFYKRKAAVAKLVQNNGSVVVDPNETVEVTVALVGLHIAGVVKDHPEFIWATFEHDKNAPTLTDEQLEQYLNVNDASINNQPVSNENFTFYTAAATFIQSNQNNAGDVKLTDPSAQALSPITEAFIQYAQGGGNEENRANIRKLNASVLSQLKDPILSNYYLGGAIWLKEANALKPNSTQQNLITGSTDLSNLTMETFTQKIKDQRNCFSCHNTMQRFPLVQDTGVEPLKGMNLNVSHILVNHYFQASQHTIKVGAGERGDDTAESDMN
jgi:hypothetical protein